MIGKLRLSLLIISREPFAGEATEDPLLSYPFLATALEENLSPLTFIEGWDMTGTVDGGLARGIDLRRRHADYHRPPHEIYRVNDKISMIAIRF